MKVIIGIVLVCGFLLTSANIMAKRPGCYMSNDVGFSSSSFTQKGSKGTADGTKTGSQKGIESLMTRWFVMRSIRLLTTLPTGTIR